MLNRTEQTFFTEKLSHLFWLQGLSPCFLTYFKIKEKVFFFSLLLNIWNKIPDPSRVENVQINIYFKTVFWHDFWRAWGCGTALPYLPTFFIAQQKESNLTMQLLFIVLAFIRQKNASWTNCGRIFRRRGSYAVSQNQVCGQYFLRNLGLSSLTAQGVDFMKQMLLVRSL